MLKRAVPFFLAVLVAVAPVALDVCQFKCTVSTAPEHATHAASEHACHHMSDSEPGTRVAAVPYTCGHSGELPTSSNVSDRKWKKATPIVGEPVIVDVWRVESTRHHEARFEFLYPPEPLHPIVALRI